MKTKIYTIATLMVTLLSTNLFALQQCVGNVQTLGISPSNGVLTVSTGYGVQYLCSFSGARNGIDVQTCKSWYAMLLTAKTTGKRILMNYNTTAQCSQIANWSDPNPMPYFVEIVD